MKIILLTFLFTLITSCGKNTDSSKSQVFVSTLINDMQCINCSYLTFNNKTAEIVINNNSVENSCVGSFIINTYNNDVFFLPDAGARSDFILNPINNSSSCSIESASSTYFINNSGVLEVYIGSIKLTMRGKE